MRDAFQGFAGGDGHPCLGARSVVRRDAYELRLYDRLGTVSAAAALNADLARFATTPRLDELSSFVAVFAEPAATTEVRFSRLLWRQLQHMHDRDHHRNPWDPRVSADPEDPLFSFSVGGNAYFVVGMHAGSSRWARRFAWPTLVFNPHEQFTALRERNGYERMRALIRGRDVDLQGTVNPTLRDHGSESEARQYAGAELGDDWRCPLHVHDRP
ncbi:MAG: YqcI/YcgG family protein [Candidatus Dormibacteraeota bacterium]|nr:YqcI/YcgG family protein [Candidatus Dormibacteraeota bacterium]